MKTFIKNIAFILLGSCFVLTATQAKQITVKNEDCITGNAKYVKVNVYSKTLAKELCSKPNGGNIHTINKGATKVIKFPDDANKCPYIVEAMGSVTNNSFNFGSTVNCARNAVGGCVCK